MIHPAIPLALLALAAPAAAPRHASGDLDGVVVAQLTMRTHIVIRVPRLSHPLPFDRAPSGPASSWKEHKGPKCVAAADLAGATLLKAGTIDLVMTDGRRLRARLDKACRPLDFYTDFYIRPAPDGTVCADRDAIRLRSGNTCEIEAFRTLSAR